MGSLGVPCLPIPSASLCRAHNFWEHHPSMSITPSGSVTVPAEQGQDTPLCCEGLSVCPCPSIYPVFCLESTIQTLACHEIGFPIPEASPHSRQDRQGMVPVAVS